MRKVVHQILSMHSFFFRSVLFAESPEAAAEAAKENNEGDAAVKKGE